MGIEAAVIGAGASLAGNMLNRRSQGKAANKANEAAAARTAQGLAALQSGYQTGQDINQQGYGVGQQMRQQGMQQGLNMIGQLYGPTSSLEQQGNLAAQRYMIAGLPMQRSAVMGGNIDYSQLQPTQIQYDPNLLSGMYANAQLPQGDVRYSPFQTSQLQR